jgi:hypothetical protein
MTRDTETDPPRNKVADLIERYGLSEFGETLERRWLGEDSPSASVRELTDTFNKRVLEVVLVDAGEVPLDAEIESIYEVLTETDGPSGDRIQLRDRLDADEGGVESLEAAMVSHQTMYRYLTQVRNVEKGQPRTSLAEQIESTQQAVQKLQNRLRSVVATNLDGLQKKEGFTLGTADVTVSITVTCSDCQTTKGLVALLRERGCACAQSDRTQSE